MKMTSALVGLAWMAMSTLTLAGASDPVRFDFVFEGDGNPATATGYIVLDRNLVSNPGNQLWNLPDPAVIDLQVTVSNSTAGDGTYTIGDFTGVVFETNGGTLDLDIELVGQPTNGDPWGTPSDGEGGDFNLFTSGMNRSESGYEPRGIMPPAEGPPEGVWYFTLAAGGSGEEMILSSMAPAGTPAPALSVDTLSPWASLLLIFMVLGGGVVMVRIGMRS